MNDKEVELPDISVTKVAIEICNKPELKKEVLCLPGSDYDMKKRDFKARRFGIQFRRKQLWNEIVEKKATIILEQQFTISEKLQEKVKGLVLLVGVRMLTWAVYHERTFGLSRRYCFDFLSSSFFTEQGIIDSTKAAEELVNDKNLTLEQRYKLACLHCFKELIPVLYRQMAKRKFYDPESPERIEQPELVKFWSYYQMGEIDILKGEKTLDQYRLEKAVESGSKSAVEFCLEKTNLRRKRYAIVEAATLAVQCKVRAVAKCTESNWFVFRDQGYMEEPCTPSDYYVDIAFFLLSKMPEDLLIEFLKQDIVGAKYEREISGDYRIPKVKYSRVLDYFLNWPYPRFFMETARLLWEYLPEKHFAVLLRRICTKIESEGELLMYGEGKIYDYRGLLKEFWCQSPERFKRYVFSNQKVSFIPDTSVFFETCAGLLVDLLTLKNFTYEDGENIKLILADATCEEKENIFSSTDWREACIVQMKDENWEILNRFVLNCFSSKEEGDKFRREFSFTREALSACIGFILDDDLNAAESFMKWNCLLEEEINKLKKEIIYSEDGMRACVQTFSCEEEVRAVDQLIRWFLPSEEEAEAFKKYLIYSDHGYYKCQSLVGEGQLELVSDFIHFCLSSEGEARELFKVIAYRCGNLICETLISDSDGEEWNRIDQFLRWCFSSEEEVNEFKRKVILNEAGYAIHFNLIKSNKWETAERFFAWLGLSAEEIKNLKKETLLSHNAAGEMLVDLIESKEGDERFVNYGSKQEAIKLFVNWYFTDKETVLDFKDKITDGISDCTEEKPCYEALLLALEERLSDLDEEI